MSRDQISKSWRKYLVDKLQEQFGLPKEEAREKTDEWLRRVGTQSNPSPTQRASLHKGFFGKSTTRAAGRS